MTKFELLDDYVNQTTYNKYIQPGYVESQLESHLGYVELCGLVE
jgi:hypothetical protein